MPRILLQKAEEKFPAVRERMMEVLTFLGRFTALRFTATDALLAARRIQSLPISAVLWQAYSKETQQPWQLVG